MCGRISQARDLMDYYASLGMPPIEIFKRMPPPRRWNVSPGSEAAVIHSMAVGPTIEPVCWGYRPQWAIEKKIAMSHNARIEKASTGYYKSMWERGRVIVPADGWFEWTGPKHNKQPWFIKRKSGEPCFMAGITRWKPGSESSQSNGILIVTDVADEGMVDIHDRRPVVLTADDARMWMNLEMPSLEAETLARNSSLPPDAFEWYQVTREVNKAGNQSPAMVESLENAS